MRSSPLRLAPRFVVALAGTFACVVGCGAPMIVDGTRPDAGNEASAPALDLALLEMAIDARSALPDDETSSGEDAQASADLASTYVAPDLQQCPPDHDGDGYTTCGGDCDDSDANVHPGAAEICNNLDDNCNAQIDEGFDQDKDGWTTCAGGNDPRLSDCNDRDPTVHPDALPRCDGNDNDCDGIIDNTEDHDLDGYAVCFDCNDLDPLVNFGAMEVPGNHIDDNCNGLTDELPTTCDSNLAFASTSAIDHLAAMEICPDQFLVGADFPTLANASATSIPTGYGILQPRAGRNFMALSTGIAAAEGQPGYRVPQSGTDFQTSAPNPALMGNNCGGPDSTPVYDYSEIRLQLRVPSNARSFSFDFNFMSAEFPEWVCKAFNDKFLALLTSRAWNNGTESNISFDGNGRPITVNNAFFTVTDPSKLAGTGYEIVDAMLGVPVGAATGWLTTTAPVQPGELITLRFIVFDEGDHILDSAVLLDHFRWLLKPAQGGASTVRTM